LSLSIGAIRLVYPITDPETGVTKDTIINELKAIPANMESEHMSFDRWEYGNKWDRVATGINVVIPWPEVQAPQHTTHAADTPRDKVEDRSFYYNLLSAPMPTPIIDELRNKYSRFRTRHDQWYIEKKQAEEARVKGAQSMMQSMQTPLQEFHAKQKAIKEARGEPVLTDDMLEKLGQVIAQAKAVSLEDAGVTDVTPTPGKTEPSSTTIPTSGPGP
jgi:large subunit ribosomal protein L24